MTEVVIDYLLILLQFVRQNLEKYCIDNGLFGDVAFELDDGHMKSHRSVLIARCDVMRAMLNGDFREAHSSLVNAKHDLNPLHEF